MVKGAKIDICKQLTGKIADGDAAANIFLMRINKAVKQSHESLIADFSP
jgi:hypothetical protein